MHSKRHRDNENQSLHFIYNFTGKENSVFFLLCLFFLRSVDIVKWLFLSSHGQGIVGSGMRVSLSFAKTNWV